MNNPLEKQVGGNHYQKYVMQPVELFMACGWNYCQSSIARYLLRHEDKNGKEDLEKAVHICDIGMEYDNSGSIEPSRNIATLQTFVRVNGLDDDMASMLRSIDDKAYFGVRLCLEAMVKKYPTQ